ncbi:MAG: SufD family Fe-S cluster assembly protein [Candidatus Korarchaeota archaeon]|nr:SufD family Fe-S cluster assembly protein [Thermoproteota archaeon]MCR8463433.1 SufD family Fe-S cluster assembly protein [Thermoproteota archaeon]MCR8471233.1 SufD family Fe-S cluster assembly protein [Thermoproteota archaeon]MCR8471926.1 SufD family Fe-S cluster assembly protein [Thermoproteota archaeon]MCR8473131.1 SufD family Fe-S cluster assembly protein [Thermoproteota archaeon]
MSWRNKYRELAKEAISKPPQYGVDVDITQFTPKEVDKNLDLHSVADILENVGVSVDSTNRAGEYYQLESIVLERLSKVPGLEIMSLEEAIDTYGKDLEPYFWNAVKVDTDKFTALAELAGKGGYFVRAKKGHRIQVPVQACLLMQLNQSLQAPHNIIIAEEGSEVSVVTGCTVMRETTGLHAGITEIYVKKGARVSFVMIHRWSEAMHIRPRTGVIVEEGGEYISNYIAFTKLKTFQSMPRVILHENARAYLASTIVLEGQAKSDSGYTLELAGNNASGQIISRAITKDFSELTTRAKITGLALGVRGHIDCQGLLLSDKSRILTIPILDALHDNVTLTHEAAVGKLAEDKILWLMARGFSRENAESILVRGFLRVDLPSLPPAVTSMIDNTMRLIAKSIL